ncbi:S-layer homology domain-containing protein [Planococcus sp. FY231025]|uniref:S-layer homology domain-containing protein n=1 Tax=Planococcus sp. FY231025 TaxID=3455699 RepID=UPI003F8E9C4B
MNNHKLFLAASAVAIAAVAVAAPVSASSEYTFTDVGVRYERAVSFLYEYEIIQGVSATKFGTQQVLTRGDAAVILANTLELDTTAAPDAGFKDLNTRVRGSVNALAEVGIASGVTKTEFKPSEPLSRGAMAKFLVSSFGLEDYQEKTPFTDVGGVFQPYIESIYGTKITSGKTPTSYGTYLNITRGEFANLLYNTINFVIDNTYSPDLSNSEAINPTTSSITFSLPVPEEYTAADAGDFFYYSIKFEDGTEVEMTPTSFTFSDNRRVLTFEHPNADLSGKAGVIIVEDFEYAYDIPFDFK